MDVHPVTVVLMSCVDRCVPAIQIVLVMNDANEDPVNRYVVVTTIAGMVRFVKDLFVPPDVVPMIIVRIICRVSINNVSIHVSVVQLVARTLNAIVSIIRNNVLVRHHLSVTQTLDVNSRRPFVANTTTVRRITLATEMYAKLPVVEIKIVCLMNDAFVESAELFAIVMLPADRDKFAKIVCVKLDVETIMCARVIKLVSIINVPIHVQQLVSVEHVQNVRLSIMVFNAVAQLVSLETL